MNVNNYYHLPLIYNCPNNKELISTSKSHQITFSQVDNQNQMNHIIEHPMKETKNNENKHDDLLNNDQSENKKKLTKHRVMFKKEDDEKIIQLVKQFGTHNWPIVASYLTEKTPKQCRDRYSNYLVPGYFNGEWSKNEDELLIKLIQKIGNKWSALHKFFPARSPVSIKNRWSYFLSRQNDRIEKDNHECNKNKVDNNLDNNSFCLDKDNWFSFDNNEDILSFSGYE